MRLREAVNFFALFFLGEGQRAEDRRQNHSRTVNPRQRLVPANRPSNLGAWNFRRADGVPGAREIKIASQPSESDVYILADRRRMPSAGKSGGSDRSGQRNQTVQAEPLMHLQHVRPLVEPRLIRRASLGRAGWKAEIAERRSLRIGGRFLVLIEINQWFGSFECGDQRAFGAEWSDICECLRTAGYDESKSQNEFLHEFVLSPRLDYSQFFPDGVRDRLRMMRDAVESGSFDHDARKRLGS